MDDNLKWQRKAEELAGRHEQRIAHLEGVLEKRDVYISNIECMLAELSGRVSEMEGKLCRCRDEGDVEVAEVEDDDDPTSELSYEMVYHTLGTRAQIPTGYMVKTLRSQSTYDSNIPSDQMLSTF